LRRLRRSLRRRRALPAVIVAASTMALVTAISAITAIGAIAAVSLAAAIDLSVPGVFAALSVSRWRRHPGCRAQSGRCRDEGFLHVEAPSVRVAHPRTVTMRRAA